MASFREQEGRRPVTRSQTRPRSPSAQMARSVNRRNRSDETATTPRSPGESSAKITKQSLTTSLRQLPNGLRETPPKSREWRVTCYHKRRRAFEALVQSERERLLQLRDGVIAQAVKKNDVMDTEITVGARCHLLFQVSSTISRYDDESQRERWYYKMRCSLATCVLRQRTPPVYINPLKIKVPPPARTPWKITKPSTPKKGGKKSTKKA